jgi:RNA polymerase-binding transcription factor DksA
MSKSAKPAKKPAKPAPKPSSKAKVAKPVPKKPIAVKTPPKAPAKAAKPAAKPAERPKAPPAKVPPKPAAKAPPPAKGAAPAKPGSKVEVKKGAPAPAPSAKAPPANKKIKPPSAPIPLPPGVGRLMDSKMPRKPLISSGPKAAHTRPLGQHGGYAPDVALPKAQTPFTPEELDGYKQLLLKKRAELITDVKGMEHQALQGQSGSLSNMPSHLAEQGSEAYDQSLSLDLAAADRRIIKEIDAALQRIADGTFGICEHTGKPIKLERLKELPWARYSIEAAREIERQAMRG